MDMVKDVPCVTFAVGWHGAHGRGAVMRRARGNLGISLHYFPFVSHEYRVRKKNSGLTAPKKSCALLSLRSRAWVIVLLGLLWA
jgi:hypothetical protein